MPRIALKLWLGLAALVLCYAGHLRAAEPYPTRPIKLIVGFPAGGAADAPARFIAERLKPILGQPVVVENKPGAGGMIALNDVLAQRNDGYTLLFCTYLDAINTVLYKRASYKLSDIAPITLVTKYYYALALSNAIPATTLGELVQYAKARPQQVLYGQVGSGSSQELVAHQLEKLVHIRMTGIPFRGANQIIPEMLAGRLHVLVTPPIAVLSFYQSQQMKILAVTSPERLPIAADVPTMTEQGLPLTTFAWWGLCAAGGTPQPIIELLNRHVRSIIASAEYRTFMENAGSIPAGSTPGELARVMLDTANAASPYIQEFHMQVD